MTTVTATVVRNTRATVTPGASMRLIAIATASGIRSDTINVATIATRATVIDRLIVIGIDMDTARRAIPGIRITIITIPAMAI